MAAGECWQCGGPGPPPPPPPVFSVPPPPRPPFMEADDTCSDEHDFCDALSVIDLELLGSRSVPPLAVVVVSSALLAAVVLIAAVLVWKYKRKPRVLRPCKGPPQGVDPSGMGFEDLGLGPAHLAVQNQPLPEVLDLKTNVPYPNGYHGPEEPTVFICSEPYSRDDLYNPVYQELSPVSTERGGESDLDSSELPLSEDDFAEDELSVAEMRHEHRHHHQPPRHPHRQRHQQHRGRGRVAVPHRRAPPPPTTAAPPPVAFHRPDHRRHGGSGGGSDFHEGLLVDTLLRHHQHQQGVPLSQHYASAPCYRLKGTPEGSAETSFTTFRPQPVVTSHDSDSGYSHNTSSGQHGSLKMT